jgi:hypothetical protein
MLMAFFVCFFSLPAIFLRREIILYGRMPHHGVLWLVDVMEDRLVTDKKYPYNSSHPVTGVTKQISVMNNTYRPTCEITTNARKF